MVSSLPGRFGSPSFFRQMKRLWGADPDAAANLLLTQVRSICSAIIRKSENGFYNLTKEDREDYVQESWIGLWKHMDVFLADSRNDPDAPGEHFCEAEQYSWATLIILHEMQHLRDRRLQPGIAIRKGERVQIISLDGKVGESDSTTTLGAIIPSGEPGPEEKILSTDLLREALCRFLELPNNSDTLAAVAYVILSETLDGKRSMQEFADDVNRHTVEELVGRMEEMLKKDGYPPSWLSSFRQRVTGEKTEKTIPEITAKKLINRKNDIQNALRKNRD